MRDKLPPCGNPECRASSGMDEHPTFGVGGPDEYGYFEQPCAICARAFEQAHPEYAPCWPFADEAMTYAESILRGGRP
jgi:hypothetical protein